MKKEVSIQAVKIYQGLSEEWKTSEDIGNVNKSNSRTTRAYLKLFMDNGIVDKKEAHPACFYKLSNRHPTKAGAEYINRLLDFKKILNL